MSNLILDKKTEGLYKRPFSEVKIRFQDCDPLGHLNNAKYIHYFMNTREDHLRNFYGKDLYDLFSESGGAWVVNKTEISYIYPVMANETVIIETAIIKLGKKDLIKEGIIYDLERRHIKTLCWIHFSFVNSKGRPTNHSEELQEFLEEIQENTLNTYNFEERIDFLRKKLKEERRA